MAAYCTTLEVFQHWSGPRPTMSPAWADVIVDAIEFVSGQFDTEVRNLRGQAEGWSFLPAQAYGVQLVSVLGYPVAGTFTLTFGATTSGALAATSTAAQIQTACDAILGAGNSVVTGAPGGPWTVTLAGTLSGAQPLIVATSALTSRITGDVPPVIVEGLITGSAANVTRRYTGAGMALLPIDDAVSVASARMLNPDGSTARTLTAGTDYLPYPLNTLPIVGLSLVSDVWSRTTGSASVTLVPGYASVLPPPIHRAAIVEVIRAVRASQAGVTDQQGLDPDVPVTTSASFLAATNRILYRYRYGGAMLRRGA